jgi:hypothetical protein
VSADGAGAGQAFETANGVDITIYTPDYNGSVYQEPSTPGDPCPPGAPANCTRPQEFLTVTSVPEPSTLAVLGFDLAGAGIVGLYFRRRNLRGQS